MGFASKPFAPRVDDPTSRFEVGVFCFAREMGSNMIGILLVGVGSFFGGVFRYGLSIWVHRLLDNPGFPMARWRSTRSAVYDRLSLRLAEARAAFRRKRVCFYSLVCLAASRLFLLLPWKLFPWLETQSLAALVHIGLQLVFGLLAVWFGNILAHAIGG